MTFATTVYNSVVLLFCSGVNGSVKMNNLIGEFAEQMLTPMLHEYTHHVAKWYNQELLHVEKPRLSRRIDLIRPLAI